MDCEWTEFEASTKCLGICGTGNKTFSRMKIFTTQDAILYDPQVPDYNYPVPTFYDAYHATVKRCDGLPYDIRRCPLNPCPSKYVLI